jgi:hypothetical protein
LTVLSCRKSPFFRFPTEKNIAPSTRRIARPLSVVPNASRRHARRSRLDMDHSDCSSKWRRQQVAMCLPCHGIALTASIWLLLPLCGLMRSVLHCASKQLLKAYRTLLLPALCKLRQLIADSWTNTAEGYPHLIFIMGSSAAGGGPGRLARLSWSSVRCLFRCGSCCSIRHAPALSSGHRPSFLKRFPKRYPRQGYPLDFYGLRSFTSALPRLRQLHHTIHSGTS